MLTPDGYINHQFQTRSIQYGCQTSDENGCGWIAVFNVLRRLQGVSPDPVEIARLMSRGVILRGMLGTYFHSIIGFLKGRGYKVRWTFRKSAQVELAARADASIFLYCGPWSGFFRWPRLQAHYIALYPEQDGRFRAFNHGGDPCRLTGDELQSAHKAFPLTLMIGVWRMDVKDQLLIRQLSALSRRNPK